MRVFTNGEVQLTMSAFGSAMNKIDGRILSVRYLDLRTSRRSLGASSSWRSSPRGN